MGVSDLGLTWLSTPEVANYVSEVSIASAPFTSRCLIYLNLQPKIRINKRNTYWKCTADLLKCDEYCNLIKDLMLETKFSSTLGSLSGVFIRCRAKWIEEGERNTAYFCG